jgi:hypothetical protein
MGGERWYDRFDELLKRIQRLRGQEAAGLKTLAGQAAPSNQE